MPYPRPVSPFSLETCEPPADDVISQDLPASDDELNDAERTAKYQRIEKLAESYLQGRPLFLLSASLKGPFDQGWRNPWRKDRNSISNKKIDKLRKKHRESVGHAVQETVVRQEGSVNATAKTELATSLPRSSHTAVCPTLPHGSELAKKRVREVPADDEPQRTELRAKKKQKETASSQMTDHSFSLGDNAEWLKKDGRRMNFTHIEPPSSPTPKTASRQVGSKARASISRYIEIRDSATPMRSRATSVRASSKGFDGENLAVDDSVKLAQSAGLQKALARQSPASEVARTSPAAKPVSKDDMSFHAEMNPAASLRVVSSTSQLPRFEYRRWLQENQDVKADAENAAYRSSPAPVNSMRKLSPLRMSTPIANESRTPSALGLASESSAAVTRSAGHARQSFSAQARNETTIPDKPARSPGPPSSAGGNECQISDQSTQSHGQIVKPPASENQQDIPNKQNEHTTKGSRLVNELATSTAPTEQDTLENLPSAQRVPTHPGISYRIPSLHSTAMPKPDTAENTVENSDTQLSTQAALLQAQRSFQEDLESPEPDFPPLAEPEDTILEPHEESLLARETPYNAPATMDHPRLDSGIPFKERMQAISTQHIIESVTPYSFSSEKKARPIPDFSPDQHRRLEPERPSTTHLASNRSRIDSSPSKVHERTALPTSDHPAHPSLTRQSTTQGTLLPFALSGSTPATAQDAQAASQGAESFDLSQAIADAGSWLQQSFDFMKDIGRPSQPAKPA